MEKGPFKKGDSFTVSGGEEFRHAGRWRSVLCGLADETGLLWYETKFSKQLTVKANKGVGPIAMAADWQVSRKR